MQFNTSGYFEDRHKELQALYEANVLPMRNGVASALDAWANFLRPDEFFYLNNRDYENGKDPTLDIVTRGGVIAHFLAGSETIDESRAIKPVEYVSKLNARRLLMTVRTLLEDVDVRNRNTYRCQGDAVLTEERAFSCLTGDRQAADLSEGT